MDYVFLRSDESNAILLLHPMVHNFDGSATDVAHLSSLFKVVSARFPHFKVTCSLCTQVFLWRGTLKLC